MADIKDEHRERIAKVMARAGVASRREAEAMIAEGRISVNSGTVRTPAVLVGPHDRIAVDGVEIGPRERTRLWLYHKPAGLVTTAHDPEGRPTVFDNLPPGLPRVVSIGRLDINTEGLLLLTNDGGLARVVALPETGWLRRYRVRAFGEVTAGVLKPLMRGITLDGMHYGPIEAAIERQQGDNIWLTVGLREGKNREVKRVLEHLGLKVNRLIRVSFGPFQLGDLAEGAVEEVRTRVLRDQLGPELARRAGVDFNAPTARDERRPPRDSGPRRSFGRDDRKASPPADKRDEGRGSSLAWRDAEADAMRPRGSKRPRRGEDPRAARSASAERTHQRAGRVSGPKGRGVLVERIVSAAKEHRRLETSSRRYRKLDPSPSGEGVAPHPMSGLPDIGIKMRKSGKPDLRRRDGRGLADRDRPSGRASHGHLPLKGENQRGAAQRKYKRRDEPRHEGGREHRRDGKPWEKRGDRSQVPWKPKGPNRDGEQRPFRKGRGDEVRGDRGGERPRGSGKPWQKPRAERRGSDGSNFDRPRSDGSRSGRPRPDSPRRGPDRPSGPRRPGGPRR
jgi:23S rRNA pseudouridine2605 synthase